MNAQNSLKGDLFNAACPSRQVLGKIANKWSLLLIDALGERPLRNGALLRRVQGISQKMLTETLRDLESMNIVARTVRYTVPPNVEYRLTPVGRALLEHVARFDRWVESNFSEMCPTSRTSADPHESA